MVEIVVEPNLRGASALVSIIRVGRDGLERTPSLM